MTENTKENFDAFADGYQRGFNDGWKMREQKTGNAIYVRSDGHIEPGQVDTILCNCKKRQSDD